MPGPTGGSTAVTSPLLRILKVGRKGVSSAKEFLFAFTMEEFSEGYSNELKASLEPQQVNPRGYFWKSGKFEDMEISLILHVDADGRGLIPTPDSLKATVEGLVGLAMAEPVSGGPASKRLPPLVEVRIGSFWRRRGYFSSVRWTWKAPWEHRPGLGTQFVGTPHHCEVQLTLTTEFAPDPTSGAKNKNPEPSTFKFEKHLY
jgi:hypothetical protein